MSDENNVENVEPNVETKKVNNNKKIITGISILVVAIVLIICIVVAVRPTPEKTAKKFLQYLDKGKFSKAFDLVDVVGAGAWANCNGDYEDFNDYYDDYSDKYEDDDMKDKLDDMIDSTVEGMEDSLGDAEKYGVEIKKIKKAKKVKDAKNLYKVEAKVKVEYQEDEDDDVERDTTTVDIYVFKKGGKYYIVGTDGDDSVGLF